MPKTRKQIHKVIEIQDSDNEESSESSESNKSKPNANTGANSLPESTSKPKEPSQIVAISSLNSKRTSNDFDIPKKVMNRRKSVHHSIRSTENLSFEFASRKRRESFDDLPKQNDKKPWDESEVDEALDKTLNDPEIDKLLRKIAYCRVFTNYMLRKYDMLALDFKLYSNLDLLNLDLNMRIETYTAIRKSRQRFKEARENGQINL